MISPLAKRFGILKGKLERGAPNIPRGFHDRSCFFRTRYADTFLWFYYSSLIKIISMYSRMDQYILIWQMYIFEHFDSYTHIYVYLYVHTYIFESIQWSCVFFYPARLQVWRIRHCWAASGRHRQTKINSRECQTECQPICAGHHGNQALNPIFRNLAQIQLK